MIVDTNVHLVARGYVRGRLIRNEASGHILLYNRINNTNYTQREFTDKVMRKYIDPTGDKWVEWMDEAGVDKAVLFGVDWAYGFTGEPRVTNREQNKAHADAAKRHPGRFIPLCALDPRRPDAVEQFTEAVEEWDMKGLKLHPLAGFYPDDPVCFPLYEKCREYGLPVVIHSGGAVGTWMHAQPLRIARVAAEFPEVRMVMAHAGFDTSGEVRFIASMLPNVYMDLGMREMDYVIDPEGFYQWLRSMMDWCTPWKIMFASDSPSGDTVLPEAEWVKVFKEPKTEINFSQEEMDIILGKAAQAVFNISE